MFSRFMRRLDQRSRLFGEMLQRFTSGSRRDLALSDAQVLSKAITRCNSCGAVERCEDWMANSDGTQGADQFCPNAEAFRQVADRKHW